RARSAAARPEPLDGEVHGRALPEEARLRRPDPADPHLGGALVVGAELVEDGLARLDVVVRRPAARAPRPARQRLAVAWALLGEVERRAVPVPDTEQQHLRSSS